ncbi:hypothetical protein BJF78_27970 [Pseudonocardia sp. CNS-139]|nr:hypothetical protein BJF78_27970 [Pseudonocardia sp. CNS-139]
MTRSPPGLPRAAVERFRQQRRPWWTALATTVAVEAARQSDELRGADVDRAARAADTLSRLGIVSSAVNANLVAGRAAHAAGRSVRARRRWSAAYELSRTGSVLVRLRGRLAGALAAVAAGDDREVLQHCRAGLADLARHRAALASMELRALASGHGEELGRLGLGVIVRAGEAARVLDWTERTRAAALLTVDPPAPDAVREERATLAALHQELVETRRETGAEPPDLLARQADAEARIRRATWGLPSARAGAGRARPAREIRGLLGDRTLVSYVRRDGEVLAVVADAPVPGSCRSARMRR